MRTGVFQTQSFRPKTQSFGPRASDPELQIQSSAYYLQSYLLEGQAGSRAWSREDDWLDGKS